MSLKTPQKGFQKGETSPPAPARLRPYVPIPTVPSCPTDRHHGTPMLLDGVRCIGAELEYDSEQSDWHGFD